MTVHDTAEVQAMVLRHVAEGLARSRSWGVIVHRVNNTSSLNASSVLKGMPFSFIYIIN